MNIKRTSVKSLLAVAVRAEIDSGRIYARISGRVKNRLLKEKFAVLAFEEKKHEKILKRLFSHLFGRAKIAVPKTVNRALLPAVEVRPSSSLAGILSQAMQAEKSAQDFYLKLAERVEEAPRKILRYLSQVEKSHFLMLRSEYTLALQYEDYAERDIDKVIT